MLHALVTDRLTQVAEALAANGQHALLARIAGDGWTLDERERVAAQLDGVDLGELARSGTPAPAGLREEVIFQRAWLLALAAAFFFGLALVLTQFGLNHMSSFEGATVSLPTVALWFWIVSLFMLDGEGWRIDAAAIFAAVGLLFPIAVTLLTFEARSSAGGAAALPWPLPRQPSWGMISSSPSRPRGPTPPSSAT